MLQRDQVTCYSDQYKPTGPAVTEYAIPLFFAGRSAQNCRDLSGFQCREIEKTRNCQGPE